MYVCVTSRVYQHRNDLVTGFSQKYQTHRLVYYELHHDMEAAITREKQIKKWTRTWKIELITSLNPDWGDLYSGVL
jgi:putative endonuclease